MKFAPLGNEILALSDPSIRLAIPDIMLTIASAKVS